jgi:tripartite-type tricarboxylate transporter receptor subunit TctC
MQQQAGAARARWWVAMATVAVVSLVPVGARADDPFPVKTITIVNPNAPGGFVDIVARGLAASMQRQLRQPVIVVNRPGANSAIGSIAVANAVPDGYTLLLQSPAFAAIPAIDEVFARPSSYQLSQFVPLAQITADPAMLLVHPSLPVRTVKEFIALAKSRPADFLVSSSGTYGTTHLPIAILEQAAGIKLRHVPYTGGAPAMAAVVGGHATALAAAPSVAMPQVKGGRVRPIAQWGNARSAAFPDVPTFRESGVDIEFTLWTALFAPAKTPAPVLKVLLDAVRAAAQDEEFRAGMTRSLSTVAYLDGPEFASAWAREVKRIQASVRFIGRTDE